VCRPQDFFLAGVCGCTTAADCTNAADGPKCENFGSGFLACGCQTTADCPTGKACDPQASYCK
jgi:hypothetical protein